MCVMATRPPWAIVITNGALPPGFGAQFGEEVISYVRYPVRRAPRRGRSRGTLQTPLPWPSLPAIREAEDVAHREGGGDHKDVGTIYV